eukprot:7101037-Pyramimonas_sp.AAC.1
MSDMSRALATKTKGGRGLPDRPRHEERQQHPADPSEPDTRRLQRCPRGAGPRHARARCVPRRQYPEGAQEPGNQQSTTHVSDHCPPPEESG